VLRRKPPVVLDHCRTSTYRLLQRGAFNDASTSNCFARSVLRSGPHASMPSSRGQAAYGGPSMSCLAVGVYRRLQISARRTCTVSSTTRSPEYVLPLLTPIHRLSTLPQSAVCCGCFQEMCRRHFTVPVPTVQLVA